LSARTNVFDFIIDENQYFSTPVRLYHCNSGVRESGLGNEYSNNIWGNSRQARSQRINIGAVDLFCLALYFDKKINSAVSYN